MSDRRREVRDGGIRSLIATLAAVVALTIPASCRRTGPVSDTRPPSVSLRVGVGQLSSTNPGHGLRQLSQIIGTVEGLARLGEDGRPEPWLAKKMVVGPDGRTVHFQLREGVKFHDGSPVDATAVLTVLP